MLIPESSVQERSKILGDWIKENVPFSDHLEGEDCVDGAIMTITLYQTAVNSLLDIVKNITKDLDHAKLKTKEVAFNLNLKGYNEINP